MNNFPDKTCDIDRLIRHPKLVTAAIEGRKTQQRRDGVYGYPSERFTLQGVEFEITNLARQTIADMRDADAQAEGFDSLNGYRDFILSMHHSMTWNPAGQMWVHSFQRC
ncbi:MAG: ASCH domain-containing protein [Mariprofundales bacterium]